MRTITWLIVSFHAVFLASAWNINRSNINQFLNTANTAARQKVQSNANFQGEVDVPRDIITKYIEKICKSNVKKSFASCLIAFGMSIPMISNAADLLVADAKEGNNPVAVTQSADISSNNAKKINWENFKLPYNHENIEFKQFLGKATIVFNMKIDDPQTVTQFPSLLEIYEKYSGEGLNVLGYPTEQGWFEPDDDETCREKSKVYYGFGSYPHAVIFDKIDVLGPSAHPLVAALTTALPTPNGYGRITLNYEKFLLDSNGQPVRRYPRKFSAYDMEPDIQAVLKGEPLPPESPAYLKAWREAKREAVKSEYSFRYNYNYYDSPDSMYKYNAAKDKI